MMTYLYAFLIGGGICVIGQILMDATKLTAPRVLVILVTAGALLQAFHLYEPLVNLAQTGARVPLPGFGYSLAKGAMEGAKENLLEAVTGGIKAAAGGITVAIGWGYRTCFQSQVGSMRGFVRRAAREVRGCRTVGDKGQLRGSEGQPVYAGVSRCKGVPGR